MKKKLAELLEKGSQAEKHFLAGLTEAERKADSTIEKWAAKDIIAHNSHWRQHHAENLLAALAGKTPSPTDDIDHANEAIYYQYRDESWEAIETLAGSSCERMKEALNALGDEGLQRVDLFPWQEGRPVWRSVVGNVYTHPILHLSDWHIKKGNAARAAEMYREMTSLLSDLDDSPDWQGTIRYNLACSFSLLGQKEKAINELREALKMNPALTEWSKQDPDFEPIRGESGYKALYG
jgi:tetratricopeptide (TPR) repeat protein